MTQSTLFQPPESPQTNEDEISYNKSVLKSAVQKCVRRGFPDRAVRVAKFGMRKDLNDFARRLMVIVPEDCVLHPKYPELARLTDKISKGKELITTEEKDLMLQIVYDIADSEWRDTEFHNPDEVVVEGEYESLSEEAKAYVLAIKYRASVGGMKWDIIFLNQYVKIWTHRFANGFHPKRLEEFFQTEKVIKYDEVEDMTPDDIPLVSIDIHCFPPIKRLLLKKDFVQKMLAEDMVEIRQKYYPNDDDEGFLAGLMWQSYISTNYKKVYWYEPHAELNRMHESLGTTPEDEGKFKWFAEQIMPEVESIAKWFMGKQIERGKK